MQWLCLKAFLSMCSSPQCRLFVQDSGAPLSRGYFILHVKSDLAHGGFNASKFSGHSFCCGQHQQQPTWASMTTRSSSWAGGTGTPTSCTWTAHSPGFFHCHLACTGSFHMVSLSSLLLFTSCLCWLEHGPLGVQRADATQSTVLSANTYELA